MFEKLKKSSLPGSSSSSLGLSSENEYSLDENQTQANFYLGSNKTNSENSTLSSNLKYNIATFEKIEVVEQILPILNEISIDIPNAIPEKTVTVKKRKEANMESKHKNVIAYDEFSEHPRQHDRHNAYKNKHPKPSNIKLCPNCQLLNSTSDYAQKDYFILSKDMIMKILLVIMVFVIFLNFILYEKLANLEKIANSLRIQSEKKFRQSFI